MELTFFPTYLCQFYIEPLGGDEKMLLSHQTFSGLASNDKGYSLVANNKMPSQRNRDCQYLAESGVGVCVHTR